MPLNYYLTVKKDLEQNKTNCVLPEYIQRGWNRIYTSKEEEFLRRLCIISPDGQIPNSVVRHRLGTLEMLRKAKLETLRKVLNLPDELFLNLSREHQSPKIINEEDDEEENLLFHWNDDDDDDNNNQEHLERKRKQSSMDILLDKQRNKRRKHDDYKYDYNITFEPLSIEEIVEEIRTNIGKDLKSEDIQLITELMQIINGSKNEQITNIYEELSRVNLIEKFGAVPKLVQALQEIQKAFEQVAMKTNVNSIETVLELLREKDKTYRVAVELLNLFHEKIKKNRPDQILNLNDKSGEISDYDHKVFDILIKDRISRLPATDLTMLINDLKSIRLMDTSKLTNNHDDRMKFLLDQLNIIFARAHLEGIKAVFNTMKSPITISLKEFIEIIENSLTTKLNESDQIIIESYILDHLNLLNDNESKIVYERLAQQGTLKRSTEFKELNQLITMGLMKKIETDGLGVVVENMKEAHLESNAMHELTQALVDTNQNLQTPSSISLEQLHKQLDMSYFIETRNLRSEDVQELAKAVHLYSIAPISLPEDATSEQCSTFLEHLKAPLIGKCIQRILNATYREKTIDLNKVPSQFYQQQIRDLFNELIHGSDQLNGTLLVYQIKERLKKTKDLPDKLYRQMFKEKLISTDAKTKIDTDKKKIAIVHEAINRILNNEKDPKQQKQLMELFDRLDVPLPERIKHWYKNKSNIGHPSSPSAKVKKDMTKHRDDIKGTAEKPERIKQTTKDRRPSATGKSSSKRPDEVKGSLPKSQSRTQTTAHPKRKSSKILDTTKNEKMNTISRTTSQFEDQKKKRTIKTPIDKPNPPLETLTIDLVPELPNTIDGISSFNTSDPLPSVSPQTIKDTSDYLDSSPSKQEPDFDHHESYTGNENVEPKEETEAQPEKDSEQLSPYNEEYVATESSATSSHELVMFQADLETIQDETITDGQMGENKIFHFEPEQTPAYLLYALPLSRDPKREINIQLNGRTAQFTTDLPYEKVKAQRILAKSILPDISHLSLPDHTAEPTPTNADTEKPPNSSMDESSTKTSRRTLKKSLKQTDDSYINSLTKSLNNLFTQSKYTNVKLRKLHDELIASGHISPLNEFYRSTNEAIRVTLEHCVTYDELMKWTLSLLQTKNKPNLIEFGHDLYAIAIDLDFLLNERIDHTRCVVEIQENLKRQLLTISDNDLREINSYLNAAQLEKLVHMSKKLNVTSKDRMISDLNSLILHLIQICYTFDGKYRPMQTRIREIAETYKSNAVADLARKLDDMEKSLSKTFGVSLFGISQRLTESRYQLIK